MILKDSLQTEHLKIKKTLEKYSKGEINAIDVKKSTANFGIYNTKDNKFMTRIRQVGGEFSAEKIRLIADIIDKNNASFAHISTRDSIQLQGVPGENIYNVIKTCTENDMPFKGGGGNAYRNPLISPLSGISKDTIFDVRPYAIKTDLYIQTFEKAFNLGRKFKISFSSELEDKGHTPVNDLGFMAKIKDGKKGFLVYAGGGMGRAPAIGDVLFDFLPADECIKVSTAMIEFFHDYGERENRSKARLRFLVEKLGFKEFKKIYKEYYDKTSIPEEYKNFQEINYNVIINLLTKSQKENLISEEYEIWKRTAVQETLFNDIFSVRLFIGRGNLSSDTLKKIYDLMEKSRCPFIRLTTEQDIYLPLVHKTFIPELYRLLKKSLSMKGSVELKFENHLVTCIGASLCSIGLLDSPVIGEDISKEIDKLFEKYPEYRGELYTQIIEGIKISGCSNSCAVNQIAPLGFSGTKKMLDGKITDSLQIFIGGKMNSENKILSKTNSNKFISISEAPKYIVSIIEGYILKLKDGESFSFEDYMFNFK
jgi:sulfite reductase beta subunit-like hemoprotein